MALEELGQHPLFRRVDGHLLAKALDSADIISVCRGDIAYDRQRFRRCLGVLLEGELQVRKESLLVSTLRSGDVFGAAALFTEQQEYPTTLIALTDCRLLLIPQETIRGLIHACGPFAEDYVSYLSGRIRFLSTRLDTVSADRGESKLAYYLLSARDGDGTVTLTATQLSQRLGVGRATLYRAFEVLERAEAISRTRKTIRIIDEKKLHSLCDRA